MNYLMPMVRVLFCICICNMCLALVTNVRGQSPECKWLYPISKEKSNQGTDVVIMTQYEWGYIDCKGKIVASPDFDEAFNFNEGVGVLIKGQNSILIDVNGNKKVLPLTRVLTKFSEGVAIAAKDDRYFIINRDGDFTAKLPQESEDPGPPDFFVSHFSNGLAPVNTPNGIGFIDSSGKFVISPQFDYTNGFQDGMASVELDGKFALIDTIGRFILSPISDQSISDPSDGLVCIQTEKNRWKYFDKNGRVVLEVDYEYAGNFVEGLAQVNLGELWGFIDKGGKQVIPLKYDQLEDFSEGLGVCRSASSSGTSIH